MSGFTTMESAQPVLHVKYPGQESADPPRTPSISLSRPQAEAAAPSHSASVPLSEAALRAKEEAVKDPSTLVSPPKKPGLSSRLSRMFSSNGKPSVPQSVPAPESSVSQATTAVSDKHSEAPSSDGANSSRAPSIVSSTGQVSHPPSRTPSHTGRQSSKERELAAPTMERKNSKCLPGRFLPLPEGGHEHTLKSARRQEKLTDMLRDAFGARKKEDGDQFQQLSLMHSWVDQLKSEKDKMATDKKGGPNQTETLVQKYGKCQEIVGRGAFGIVRISHKPNAAGEQLYAVKEFRRRPQESPKKYQKRLTSEFCISSSLRHPNVIHTLDLLQDAKGDYCEVMEFCAGGDLYSLVLAATKLEVAEADCFFKQLMRGVEYMHEMGVAHRDLKPENLLLTSHGALKITDFGNGECFRMAWEKEAHMTAGLCGSAPYISPEEYLEKEFDPRAVDVWACGVIYMAMRTGRHLWRVAKRDEDEFFENYLRGRKSDAGYGPIESLHRARCRNVIYSILDPNPGRRITASQVLKSEWGREIKICKAGEEGL